MDHHLCLMSAATNDAKFSWTFDIYSNTFYIEKSIDCFHHTFMYAQILIHSPRNFQTFLHLSISAKGFQNILSQGLMIAQYITSPSSRTQVRGEEPHPSRGAAVNTVVLDQ